MICTYWPGFHHLQMGMVTVCALPISIHFNSDISHRPRIMHGELGDPKNANLPGRVCWGDGIFKEEAHSSFFISLSSSSVFQWPTRMLPSVRTGPGGSGQHHQRAVVTVIFGLGISGLEVPAWQHIAWCKSNVSRQSSLQQSSPEKCDWNSWGDIAGPAFAPGTPSQLRNMKPLGLIFITAKVGNEFQTVHE